MKSVADLLKKSLTLYRDHFGVLIGYAAWLLLPLALLLLIDVTIATEPIGETLTTAIQIFQIILTIWISVAITLVVAALYKKQKINTSEISTSAWGFVWPVFWVSLVLLLIHLAGIIMLIVPFFLFLVWYAFVGPIIVLEGGRGLTTLGQSRELSRGRYWPILWRLLAGPIALALLFLLATTLVAILSETVATGGFDPMTRPSDITRILGAIVEILFTPIFVVYGTLLYFDVKRTKSKTN